MGLGAQLRRKLAKRAAEEIKAGMLVNLGIGIPSLIPDFLPESFPVTFHAENGIIGIGPSPEEGEEEAHLCNAGGFPVTLIPGGCYCDSAEAFGIIRSGRIDMTVLGALQVSEKGDLANWIVPGRSVPGMGGAMELAACAKKVIVLMSHTDNAGAPKLKQHCSLPLTAEGCVHMVITEIAVFERERDRLVLKEIFLPYTLRDVRSMTEAAFEVSEGLRFI